MSRFVAPTGTGRYKSSRVFETIAALLKGPCTSKMVCERTGLAKTTANKHLEALVKAGIVELLQERGWGTSAVYCVPTPERALLLEAVVTLRKHAPDAGNDLVTRASALLFPKNLG